MSVSNFRSAKKHEYVIPDDGDPRWRQIFDLAPRIVTRYHGPLPAGPVVDMTVMFILRIQQPYGYDEVIYFANSKDIERWNLCAALRSTEDPLLYESIAAAHPKWTVAQIIDYAEKLSP